MGSYNWIHCYKCFNIFSQNQNINFYLTGCCVFVCGSCSDKSPNRCMCGGSCKKVAISSKMPKDVQMLLTDPTDHLKQLMKNIDFQGKHKFHLLRFKHQNLGKLKSEINEINSKIMTIERELQNKQDMYNNMKSQIQKFE